MVSLSDLIFVIYWWKEYPVSFDILLLSSKVFDRPNLSYLRMHEFLPFQGFYYLTYNVYMIHYIKGFLPLLRNKQIDLKI